MVLDKSSRWEGGGWEVMLRFCGSWVGVGVLEVLGGRLKVLGGGWRKIEGRRGGEGRGEDGMEWGGRLGWDGMEGKSEIDRLRVGDRRLERERGWEGVWRGLRRGLGWGSGDVLVG
jgi:hypothetical protein